MYYSSCECMNIPILSLNTCPGPQLTTRSQWVHPLSSVAEDDWEKQQLQLACQQSLEESQQAKEALERCQNAVAERLRELGMQRLDTIADGNCLYVALAFSCGLPIQPEHLRREICAYILHMKDFFWPWMDTSSFEAYVSHMETDGAYGDELSLQSAAHLFVRPIRVIGEDPEKDRLFQPPESISADCWGAPVFLSYVAFNHFEATEPLRVKEELPA